MSAQEIIEQIKALPREEQQAVVDFLNKGELFPAAPERKPHTPEQIDALIEKIFDEHDELFRKLAQ